MLRTVNGNLTAILAMAKQRSSANLKQVIADFLEREQDPVFAALTRDEQADQLNCSTSTLYRARMEIEAGRDDEARLPKVLWMPGVASTAQYLLRHQITERRLYLADFPNSRERHRIEAELVLLNAALTTRVMLETPKPNVG